MIIDSLTHITGDGRWPAGGYDASAPALLKSMSENGVTMSVLAGMPGFGDWELIMETCRMHPDRFIPVAGIDTGKEAEKIEAEVTEAGALGFRGIKIHPRICRTPLLSDNTSAAIDAAASLGLTVLICTIHRPPLPPLGRPLSDALHELCARHPEARIVLLHGGYYDLLATSELVRPFEHVLLDLSLTITRFQNSSLANDICFLLETFEKRITIGSDFPEGSMDVVLNVLKQLGFSRERLLDMGVLGKNILRFFPNTHI